MGSLVVIAPKMVPLATPLVTALFLFELRRQGGRYSSLALLHPMSDINFLVPLTFLLGVIGWIHNHLVPSFPLYHFNPFADSQVPADQELPCTVLDLLPSMGTIWYC